MKFEIKNQWDGSLIFSVEAENWRVAVEAAIGAKANLRSANLSSADLSSANLSSANLRSAKGLERFPISIMGHKHPLWTTQSGKLCIGCHVHTFSEWERHVEKIGEAEDYSAIDVEIYKLHIAHLKKVSELLWNKKEK